MIRSSLSTRRPVEKDIPEEKINEIVQMMLKDDVAFEFVSLEKKPYEILVELAPHPGHKISEFTSSMGMVSCPFLFLVKDRIQVDSL